jgi:hypothetical protein
MIGVCTKYYVKVTCVLSLVLCSKFIFMGAWRSQSCQYGGYMARSFFGLLTPQGRQVLSGFF